MGVKVRYYSVNFFPSLEYAEHSKHFPKTFLYSLDNLIESTKDLQNQNSKRLARFVLLKVYQSMLNNRDSYPSTIVVKEKIGTELNRILLGLESFRNTCKEVGITKHNLLLNRRLLNRSSIEIETDNRVKDLIGHPRLVFTSPPYPGVHVLYNKWQISSRKETYLPYYISGMNDSQPEAYYTMGGRSGSGVVKYFELISQSFISIAKVVHPKAIISQLVGFSDTREQLPQYLKAMENAGYKEIFPIGADGERKWRDVPNRKWYTNGRNRWDSSKEVLLFHTLC